MELVPENPHGCSRRLLAAPKFRRARNLIALQAGLAEQLIDFTDPIRRSAGHGDNHLVKFIGPAFEQTFRHPDHRHVMDESPPFLTVIIEESDDDPAEIFLADQFQGKFRACASGPDDADPSRRIGSRVFLSRRAFAP